MVSPCGETTASGGHGFTGPCVCTWSHVLLGDEVWRCCVQEQPPPPPTHTQGVYKCRERDRRKFPVPR